MPNKKRGSVPPKKKKPKAKVYRPPSSEVVVFTEPQQLLIVQWLAEGLTTREMNALASAQKPPFSITPSEAYYYRVSRQIDVTQALKMRESEAFNSGFAKKENRVIALNNLGQRIYEELGREGGMWLNMVKGIGSGQDYERIEYVEFNRAQIEAFRNILDDVATELGQRVRRSDVTSKDRPLAAPGLPASAWSKLTDEEVELLERATEIVDRLSAADPSTST